jgi:hypothetical protein
MVLMVVEKIRVLVVRIRIQARGNNGGSSKSFGERHTTICGVGPTLLGATDHFLLGSGLKALCS